MVSEAPSEEASLSDVFYIYLLILHPRYFSNYVSFHGGSPPPRGPCSIGFTFFPVHVIILPVAAKSIDINDINSILIILIIFIMLLNFNGLYWRRPPPPPPLYLTPRLGIYLQKLNTFLFKLGGSSTPH